MIVRRLLPGGPTAESDGSGSLRELYFVNGSGLTDANVLSAVDSTSGLAIPAYGTANAGTGLTGYTVRSIAPDCVGANGQGLIYIVDVGYRSPSFSPGGDPITTETQYEWDYRVEEIETTQDRDGNPILNAAGDPPEGTFRAPVPIIILRVYERKDTYSPTTMYAVTEAVNSHDVRILDLWTVTAGNMKCVGYRSLGRRTITSDAPYDIEHIYEIQAGYWPWEHHALNQGYNGWWMDDTTERKDHLYALKAKDPVEAPVLLDALGQPWNWHGVGVGQQMPIDNPDIADITKPVLPATGDGWMEYRTLPGNYGTEMIARRCKEYDFRTFITGVFSTPA
jgi:hypothetical protein